MSKSNNGTPNSAWVCAGKIEHGAASCPSRYNCENEIKTILYETFRGDKFDANSCVEMYVKAYEAILSGNEAGRRIEEIKKEMEALTKIGKTAEKRLNTEKEPSPQMGMVPGMRGLNEGLTAVRSWRVPPAR